MLERFNVRLKFFRYIEFSDLKPNNFCSPLTSKVEYLERLRQMFFLLSVNKEQLRIFKINSWT